MVPYKIYNFCVIWKSKMATTKEQIYHRILKPQNCLTANFVGMILEWSFTKSVFFVSIGNHRWLSLQDIVLAHHPIWKYRNKLWIWL